MSRCARDEWIGGLIGALCALGLGLGLGGGAAHAAHNSHAFDPRIGHWHAHNYYNGVPTQETPLPFGVASRAAEGGSDDALVQIGELASAGPHSWSARSRARFRYLGELPPGLEHRIIEGAQANDNITSAMYGRIDGPGRSLAVNFRFWHTVGETWCTHEHITCWNHIHLDEAESWYKGTAGVLEGTAGEGKVDLWATLEHELGHSIGLGDLYLNAYDPTCPVTSAVATMCAIRVGKTYQRVPEREDVDSAWLATEPDFDPQPDPGTLVEVDVPGGGP